VSELILIAPFQTGIDVTGKSAPLNRKSGKARKTITS